MMTAELSVGQVCIQPGMRWQTVASASTVAPNGITGNDGIAHIQDILVSTWETHLPSLFMSLIVTHTGVARQTDVKELAPQWKPTVLWMAAGRKTGSVGKCFAAALSSLQLQSPPAGSTPVSADFTQFRCHQLIFSPSLLPQFSWAQDERDARLAVGWTPT